MKKNLTGEELRNYNKQRVLDETIALIGEKGIYGTKVADIAKRAGVTPRSIERYYGGKENLLEMAAYRMVDKNSQAMAENLRSLQGKNLTGLEFMESFLDLQIAYFKENYIEYLSIEEIEKYFYRKDLCRDLLKEHFRHLKKMRIIVEQILEYGKKDGSIRNEVSATAVSDMVNAVLQGTMMRIAILYKNPCMEDIDFDELAALYLARNGLLKYLKNEER